MDMNGQPLVSVVVPVYNVEKYIARCIESILNQTHENFELILVDDGSPDRSGEICDAYALKDSRIRVIHTPNRGPSCARNTGLDCAAGEYLLFVDSDDWIEPNHIEVLLPVGDEDLVYGGTKLFKNAVLFDVRTPPDYVATREEWMSDYTAFVNRGLRVFFIHPCYRMRVIRDNCLRFHTNLRCGEDGTFNVTFLEHCQKVRYSSTSTYCYEDGDDTSNSLSHQFRPYCIQAEIVCNQAVEHMTKKNEYDMRWESWQGIIRHFRKWLTFNHRIHRKEAKKGLKEAYRSKHFRESIPYIRKTGTLDQRVKTYFMSYWLAPFYKPVYAFLVFLSRIKRRIVHK